MLERLLRATRPRAGSPSLVPGQLRAGAQSPGEGIRARNNQAACLRVAPKARWGQGAFFPLSHSASLESPPPHRGQGPRSPDLGGRNVGRRTGSLGMGQVCVRLMLKYAWQLSPAGGFTNHRRPRFLLSCCSALWSKMAAPPPALVPTGCIPSPGGGPGEGAGTFLHLLFKGTTQKLHTSIPFIAHQPGFNHAATFTPARESWNVVFCYV